MGKYDPPYKVTNEILSLTKDITLKCNKIDSYDNLNQMPVLRRNNQIKSIHSSLAIEANTLSLDKVMDIIDGKVVVGPANEIMEVKNAYLAYKKIDEINPYNLKDFLLVHKIMMNNLIKDNGNYRNTMEGVFDKDRCIFMAPPPNILPILMNNLFKWMKSNQDKINPLILSCVFHYELVFIHPFSDGNGRMARIWQTALLSKWKPLFKYIPVESLILKHQSEYYEAIDKSNKEADSSYFICFLLKMINSSLDEEMSNNC
jgi:Fic family protein